MDWLDTCGPFCLKRRECEVTESIASHAEAKITTIEAIGDSSRKVRTGRARREGVWEKGGLRVIDYCCCDLGDSEDEVDWRTIAKKEKRGNEDQFGSVVR